MALRRLYSVCVRTSSRADSDVDFICGMTVARSDEEVKDIVRMHVPPHKRFEIRALQPGDSDPLLAGDVAAILEQYSFRWLDPRPERERDDASLRELVPRLITVGLAL
jgi:hypothetical protein